MIFMGSPFQPDTAADWWNFGTNALIAFLTLGALVWTILQSQRANARAAAAELRADAAEEKAARLDSEKAWLEKTKHARNVWHTSVYNEDPTNYEGDGVFDFETKFMNAGMAPVHDVGLLIEAPFHVAYDNETTGSIVDNVDAAEWVVLRAELATWRGFSDQRRPPVSVEFVDVDGNAWLRTSTGELREHTIERTNGLPVVKPRPAFGE